MNKFIPALALLPALFATSAMAQTVSDDVTKELWCGEALVVAFSAAPSDATSAQLSQAQVYIDGGNHMIDEATQKHLDAGFTEEQVTKLKTDIVAEVTPIVTGDGSGAKYSFEDCAAMLPSQPAAPSTPDTSSSAAN